MSVFFPTACVLAHAHIPLAMGRVSSHPFFEELVSRPVSDVDAIFADEGARMTVTVRLKKLWQPITYASDISGHILSFSHNNCGPDCHINEPCLVQVCPALA
ncbi:hypothetical protein BC826DRAFT_1041888 [Russula brevipes]|nr:hypothetical protein BC826DRAFT_1041888 [Russula brevipes]